MRAIGAGTAPPCSWVNVCVPVGETVTELADTNVNEIGIVNWLLNRPGELIWILAV